MDMLQQNGHVGIVWTEDVPRASPSATRRPDSGETRSNEGEMAGQRPPFALVGLDLNEVPLFCTTEFGFTYQRRTYGVPVSDLVVRKVPPTAP